MGKISTKRKVIFSAQCTGSVLLIALAITANCVCNYFSEPITQALGVIGATTGTGEIRFQSDYDSQEAALAGTEEVIQDLVGEGAVLLKNDNGTLPIQTSASDKAKVSLFGIASYSMVTSGSGSGSTSATGTIKLKDAMEEVNFDVNPTLWSFYETCAGEGYGTGAGASQAVGGLNQRLSEVPQTKYTNDIQQSLASYNDAAIVVFGRSGSEGVDLSRNLASLNDGRKEDIAAYEDGQHYLELTKEEKDLLSYVHTNFENVVVLINSPSAMELGFLDEEEYGIDSCLWIGAPGRTGVRAVSNILAGNINPSGRLVDTYVYDNLSAPSTENFGDYRYGDENYFYVTYQEGIYVGYRYYETRYEDYVLNQGNAGNYDYAQTVQFPFGYGLNYNEFQWENFQMEDQGETVTLSVDVKNLSDAIDGKEVVQAYVGAPYTAGGVEKASVSLVGFDKTEIAKGETQTIRITIDKKDLASYDDQNNKTYVLEDGTYYLTLASDAHEAENNILEKKREDGANIDNQRMVGEGDASFVGSFTVEEDTLYDEGADGTKITNHFEEADIANENSPAYDASFHYLSRNDWEGTYPESYATGHNDTISNNASGFVETREISDTLLAALEERGIEASGNPNAESDYTPLPIGQEGNRELVELIGKSYDDPLWDELLSQVSLEEMTTLVASSGYQTMAIESINKPKTYDYDGPAGLTSFFTRVNASAFPVEALMGSTWNRELLNRAGNALGNEALWAKEGGRANGVTGWYAPGINIHRSPFGGRNFEYYSEDPYLTGELASSQIQGCQSKGIFCYMKHFALNDQESNRSCSGNISNDASGDNGGMGLATWSNEQAIREIYLRPFEIAVTTCKDKTLGIMSSFNRIGATWTGGSYDLITNVLRNEWGFDGTVITDYWEGEYMNSMQMLAAGGDVMLISAANSSTRVQDTDSKRVQSFLQDSLHHVCYTVCNSAAMNGVAYGAMGSTGFPNYYFIIIALYVLAAGGTFALMFFGIRSLRKELQAGEKQEEGK